MVLKQESIETDFRHRSGKAAVVVVFWVALWVIDRKRANHWKLIAKWRGFRSDRGGSAGCDCRDS